MGQDGLWSRQVMGWSLHWALLEAYYIILPHHSPKSHPDLDQTQEKCGQSGQKHGSERLAQKSSAWLIVVGPQGGHGES